MKKTYDPQAIEKDCYQNWENSGYFKAAVNSPNSAYSIVLPPPNVTGSLHMGHAFQHTLMDVLIRYFRMRGDNTLWQPGTDHAGIATQMVVERQLDAKGQNRRELGREKFLEKVWQWKEHSGGEISKQMRRLGTSPDWSRERFTMDEDLSDAVLCAFVTLYEQGLIYRGKRLVNWDPKLLTAISDLEVENKELPSSLWHFRYPLAANLQTKDGKNYLTVATTRPETMLGDAAVAVHPKDERYRDLIGKKVLLPLVDRALPIVADEYVDMEFGSGCVKITPAHDFNDYELGKRHQLPLINIFSKDAKVLSRAEIYDSHGKKLTDANTDLPPQFAALERFVARDKIVAQLQQQNLVEKIEKHQLNAPFGDRSKVIIEPMLTDQWFVKAKTLAKPAIEKVEDGSIKFVPKQYENMYFAWMRDIQDWCISRQLWWGHRIPAWFDDKGNVYVAKTEAAVRQKYQLAADLKLSQDPDVLDTWFSSALWPFSTLGWPEKTAELAKYYPTSVLVTGFDIIFFWVARMIMMGLHFLDQVPFKEVYITGLVRDENGQKMSKSLGNVLDPLDLIDGQDLPSLLKKRTTGLMQPELAPQIEAATRKSFPEGMQAYGTDALRFTLASMASTGRDIKFDLKRMQGYRNFCNKLWNAARFVLMNLSAIEKQAELKLPPQTELALPERWILNGLEDSIAKVKNNIEQYRFDLGAKTLYDFIWHQYCDWYIEIAKTVLQDQKQSAAKKATTATVLLLVLEKLLRLAHPFIPYISESIWQALPARAKQQQPSIMLCSYPQLKPEFTDATAGAQMEWIKGFILQIRQIRGEMNISFATKLPVLIDNAAASEQQIIEQNRQLIYKLAGIESIAELQGTQPESAVAMHGQMKILIPLANLIDKQAELERLQKAIDKLVAEKKRLSAKLENANFVQKAPPAVVAKEQKKLTDTTAQLDELKQQQSKIAALEEN